MYLISFWRQTFSTLFHQKKPISNVYNLDFFQQFIVENTTIFRDNLSANIHKNTTLSKFAALAFVCLSEKRKPTIVDFGGGAGIDFFIARHLFGLDLKWICIETEVMCRIASTTGLNSGNLQFFSFDDYLQSGLLNEKSNLYLNSSLQYTPKPLEILRTLLSLKPRKVALIRTPVVVKGTEFRSKQNSLLEKNGPQIGPTGSVLMQIENSVEIGRAHV